MNHLANVNAMMSSSVAMESTLIMTHVTANVQTHQRVNIHTILIKNLVDVSASHMSAIQVSTSTTTVAAVNAMSTKPAMTINTSMTPLASVFATI